jgi:ribose 1,5-bisphosphokinase PhnN
MNGRLIYVMGPSGAGKDSLLGFARDRLKAEPILFAHRYITRPSGNGEAHVELTVEEFEVRCVSLRLSGRVMACVMALASKSMRGSSVAVRW